MAIEFKFGKHEKVKDTLTGLVGNVIRVFYDFDTDERQYLLTTLDKVGHPTEWWVTESRLSKWA